MNTRLIRLGIAASVIAIAILLALALRQETGRASRAPLPGPQPGILNLDFDFEPVEPLAGPTPGAVERPAHAPDSAPVSGVVVERSGSPIEGAAVALMLQGERAANVTSLEAEDRYVLTDRTGTFALAANSVTAGDLVELNVRARGFLPFCRPLPTGQPAEGLTVVLERGLGISGTVFEPVGNEGVPGLRVVARGTRAPVATGDPAVFAATAAAVQWTNTAEDGTYTLSGLAPGWYQVEVVARGLIVTTMDLKNAEPSLAGASHGIHVQAGASGVEFRVMPLTVVEFAVMDAATKACVPWVMTRVDVPEDRIWGPSANYSGRVLVANGQTSDLRRRGLPQGHHAYLVISRTWPDLEHKTVRCHLAAAGYRGADVEVPVRWAGDDGRATVVSLEPEGRHGAVQFGLKDAEDKDLGDVSLWLLLRAEGNHSDSQWAWVCFGDDGAASAVSLPVGTWKLGTDPMTPTLKVREDTFVVRDGVVEHVPVYLVSGGFRVAVRDENGEWLDDVGVMAKPGHAPVQVEYVRVPETSALAVFGEFLVAPGLGSTKPVVRVGARLGPWTVEAYRHGYDPVREFISVSPGRITEVEFRMKANPSAKWDAWERQSVNRLEDVAPPR